MIIQKLTKYIEKNFCTKYYILDNIDFNADLRANAPLNSNLATEMTHYISSEKWQLEFKYKRMAN
ncbi:hypothetical protein [Francisella sp. SYW-9]|uniref:hypothetical protein n=1 Tax=Francisella sp. SYW-9 TaxID=2610888 RepID=UPI00123C8204|nr:hypothetical protein [Francisella sp. SYW-9]